MRVGAVTVNYNAGDHLIRCIESLVHENVDQIIVVDNGSKDDSLEKLAARFPDVPVVRLPNPGLGTATNVGATMLDDDIDVVFVVNPDTVVGEGAVAAMKRVLTTDDNVGLVGPRIDNPDGSRYPSARRFPSFVDGAGHAIFGMMAPNNRWSRRYKMADTGEVLAGSVDWVSGAAMFTRKSAFDSVQGFDEGYFMYMEDTDLCFRLHRAGWDVRYEPEATVVHVQGVSTRQRAYKMIRVHHQSLLRYHARNAEGMNRLFSPLVLLGIAVRLPIALGQRFASDKLASRRRPRKVSDKSTASPWAQH